MHKTLNQRNVGIVVNGKFSMFHIARQLERFGVLEEIITSYPRFKLRDEEGIPVERIKCFPWLHAGYMFALSKGLDRLPSLHENWAYLSTIALDQWASKRSKSFTIVIGSSSSALKTARHVKENGGKYICHRGSSHIVFQNNLLTDEYSRWGLPYNEIDPRIIERELEEYELADRITVPSTFARDSFVKMGMDPQKVRCVPYGARINRFSKIADPPKSKFILLWVGAVSVRKAFLDALEAFHRLKHPNKEFRVVGSVENLMRSLLSGKNLDGVIFLGTIPNAKLSDEYSKAHVLVLPSVEEGLAAVQTEALACGCPVIASENTGGRNIFTPGKEGFEVPIRSPARIAFHLQELADNPDLHEQMSQDALQLVKSIGGWDCFGDKYFLIIKELYEEQARAVN